MRLAHNASDASDRRMSAANDFWSQVGAYGLRVSRGDIGIELRSHAVLLCKACPKERKKHIVVLIFRALRCCFVDRVVSRLHLTSRKADL